MAYDFKTNASTAEERAVLELVLEAARRANWDAMHGPKHLRMGRYFIDEPSRVGDGTDDPVASSTPRR